MIINALNSSDDYNGKWILFKDRIENMWSSALSQQDVAQP